MGPILAKYGTQLVVPFHLYKLDGSDFELAAVHAAGDTTLIKDEGAEANTTNGFVDEGTGYSLTLTATEMQAARLLLSIRDQTGPMAWLPKSIPILTFGHASAHIGFDLSQATPAVNVSQLNGSATAAAKQALAALGVVSGSAVTGTLSTTEATTDLAFSNADQVLGRQLVPISGAAVGNAVRIRKYEVTSGKLLFNAMTVAMANGDQFIIV